MVWRQQCHTLVAWNVNLNFYNLKYSNLLYTHFLFGCFAETSKNINIIISIKKLLLFPLIVDPVIQILKYN